MNKECVYLVRAGDYYKFGITNNIENRVSSLQNGNPFKVNIVDYVEYESREFSMLAEKTIFRYLGAYRMQG